MKARFLVNASIERKLRVIILVTTGLALGVAVITAGLFEYRSMREQKPRDLAMLGGMIVKNRSEERRVGKEC